MIFIHSNQSNIACYSNFTSSGFYLTFSAWVPGLYYLCLGGVSVTSTMIVFGVLIGRRS